MGLEFPIDLAASGTSSFTITFQYGEMPAFNCDFDNDGNCNGTDINMMMAAIAGGADPPEFDLNNDGSVDTGDRDEWLSQAGQMNIGAAYLVGDATLDGVVDGLDFIEWNDNKFSASTDWAEELSCKNSNSVRCSRRSNWPWSGKRCKRLVIHQENRSAFQMRASAFCE